jgi:hypothetical protein
MLLLLLVLPAAVLLLLATAVGHAAEGQAAAPAPCQQLHQD